MHFASISTYKGGVGLKLLVPVNLFSSFFIGKYKLNILGSA